MLRHELLRQLHALVKPRTYLEIGVNDGRSLALSRAPSVGIDPAFKVTSELRCNVCLAKTTSDEFFAREQPLAHFRHPVVDLAFIDGMHLAEYALRDFINVERYTTPATVIVLDDMLPGSVDEAARNRHTRRWTGDVYKVVQTLRRLRPDLLCFEVDTKPTGTAVVLLPDASSATLRYAYDDLVEGMVVDDPQDVPTSVIARTNTISPDRLLTSSMWPELLNLRDRRRPTPAGEVRRLYERSGIVGLAGALSMNAGQTGVSAPTVDAPPA